MNLEIGLLILKILTLTITIMAKQTGIIQFTGNLGGLSFYNHKFYGMLVRQRNPVSRERIKHGPEFERTRENNSEFGSSSSAAALIRNRLKGFLYGLNLSFLDTRLVSFMCAVRNEDVVSGRGKRRVEHALAVHPELLDGFEFCKSHVLTEYTSQLPIVDRSAGTMTFSGFLPDHVPPRATHVALQGLRAHVNFRADSLKMRESDIVVLPLDGVKRDVEIEIGMPEMADVSEDTGALSVQQELFVARVHFLQEVNGELYDLAVGAAKLLCSSSVAHDVVNEDMNESANAHENEDLNEDVNADANGSENGNGFETGNDHEDLNGGEDG